MADMSVGSWYQATKRDTAGVSTGKVSDEPLTYAVSQATAGVASGVLIAASTAITRTVLIFVPATATTGIYIDFGATASSADFFIPSGGTLEIVTLQAINCIRAGADDVTVYILAGSKT